MRLIDADKLYLPYEEIASRMSVHYAPTVDAVLVVRCKDCKWFNMDRGWCVYNGIDFAGEDFYCAHGEEK